MNTVSLVNDHDADTCCTQAHWAKSKGFMAGDVTGYGADEAHIAGHYG